MTTPSIKRVALMAVLCCFVLIAAATAAPYEIPFKSGTIAPRAGAFSLPASAPSAVGERVHVLLQLEDYLAPGDRARLSKAGVELLNYLPDRAYAASLSRDFDVASASRLGIRSIVPFAPEYKIHPRVSERRLGEWSLWETGERVFALEIMADVALDDAAKTLTALGYLTGNLVNAAHTLHVVADEGKVIELAALDFVLFLNEVSPPLDELNNVVRQRLHVNEVQAAPYSLSGDGVTILVYDGGMADNTHPDFAGRMTWAEDAAVADHPTHTAGTVGGSGANNNNYRGMAPAVTLISGQYDFCIPYCFYNSPNDIEGDYTSARELYSIELTTNSMGANINSNQYDCDWFGDYETTERMLDGLVRNTVDGPLLMFWSAGNERNDTWCAITTYGCVSIPASAKNIMTIGATTSTDAMASFSSWGPVDDGRIKPEVVAMGVNVTSCAPGGGYQTMSGTSMSCPAAAGVACLVLEQWHDQFPGAPDPLPETMKALMINSATDLGNVGPDYQRGFGLVNAQQAVDDLIAGGVLESSLEVGETYTHTFTVPQGTTELSVSLAWSDVPAAGNIIPTLVNDLDLVLTAPNATDHLPWILNPASPGNAAITGEDHTNICEQVHVNNPAAGEWTLTVSGAINSGDSQTFGLASNVTLVSQWTTIAGQTLDPGLNGVPGKVSIVGSSQAMWTDADGNYAFSVPRGATYTLSAVAFGFVPMEADVAAVGETAAHNFNMVAAPEVTLSGTVTNSIGEQLQAAIVSARFPNADDVAAPTNAAGFYTMQLPAAGNVYEVTADYEGLALTQTITLTEAATLDFELMDPRVSPAGPDEYGYYCYEDADTGLTVEYAYASIMPSQGGFGTVLGPGDGNDWLLVVPLPFNVRYYGQEFTQVTVSADGWVGFGDVAGGQSWTNVEIPDVADPDGMIAVFWDDLYPYEPTNGGEIGEYYDADNGRYIIEFREVPHFNPLTNHVTAQLVIYTQETRPTVTGDNEFELHFERFDYVGPGPTVDADATIGIESPNGGDGINVVYDGTYHENNFPLAAQRALRFTTGLFAGQGALDGQITTIPPLADYSVFTISLGDYSASANTDGTFLIEDIDARQYRVTAEAEGYETIESELISILADQTTTVDFTDVYRLDPARNMDGNWNIETNIVSLFWDRPEWAETFPLRDPVGGSLDDFFSYSIVERSRGEIGTVQDTFFTWQPPNIGFYFFWAVAHYDGGVSVNSDTVRIQVLDADELPSGIPAVYSLSQNFPNPFNPSTRIEFGLPVASDVRLEVFDILGRTVAILANGRLNAGLHSVEFNAHNIGTGIYFYRLRAGSFEQLRKMLLVR